MESLSDKLKSLGVVMGAEKLEKPKRRSGFSVAETIPGEVITTPYGDTYQSEHIYPLDYHHGIIHFHPQLNLRVLAGWGRVPQLTESDLSRFVFLDTETTGLGGGTGTFAFLVGLGHLETDGFHLVQLLMREPSEEPAMLYLLNQHLATFPAVVTFNGKSFDAPLLNARHVLNGMSSPFSNLQHIDLLPLARRLWRNRLPSRALGDLEVEILALSRTQEEVPGYLIPEIYFEYLRSADARPLNGVMYHNGMDILSLAALFQHVDDLLSNPLGYTAPQSLDLIAIARLYEELGEAETAIRLYETSLDLGLTDEFLIQTLQRFADLYRKRGDWEKSIELWTMSAQQHHMDACVELAKYYEHRARDYSAAIRWTEQAMAEARASIRGLITRREVLKELTHRHNRLIAKQQASLRKQA